MSHAYLHILGYPRWNLLQSHVTPAGERGHDEREGQKRKVEKWERDNRKAFGFQSPTLWRYKKLMSKSGPKSKIKTVTRYFVVLKNSINRTQQGLVSCKKPSDFCHHPVASSKRGDFALKQHQYLPCKPTYTSMTPLIRKIFPIIWSKIL